MTEEVWISRNELSLVMEQTGWKLDTKLSKLPSGMCKVKQKELAMGGGGNESLYQLSGIKDLLADGSLTLRSDKRSTDKVDKFKTKYGLN